MKAASRNLRVHRHTAFGAARTPARLRPAAKVHEERHLKPRTSAQYERVATPARRRFGRGAPRSTPLRDGGTRTSILGPGNGMRSPLWGGEGRSVPSLGMFEPDILVPAQFFPTAMTRAAHKRGEYQLLIAILEDAVHCYQKYVHARTRQERRLFEEAEQWLMRPDATLGEDERPLVSFGDICAVLDLDPEFLRCGLRRWREQQLTCSRRSQPPIPNTGTQATIAERRHVSN
jgi:hypothetical protein